jgi:hypothetical protein
VRRTKLSLRLENELLAAKSGDAIKAMRTELDMSKIRWANQCSRPPQGGGRGCHHEGPGEWRHSCSQAAAVLGGSV